jgi:hypothetical protein
VAELTELSLLLRREDRHCPGNSLGVPREILGNEPAALLRERDLDLPSILSALPAPHQTAGCKVVYDKGDVSLRSQKLASQLGLAHGSEVQKRLEDPELRHGERVGKRSVRHYAGSDSLNGSIEPNEGVECQSFLSLW